MNGKCLAVMVTCSFVVFTKKINLDVPQNCCNEDYNRVFCIILLQSDESNKTKIEKNLEISPFHHYTRILCEAVIECYSCMGDSVQFVYFVKGSISLHFEKKDSLLHRLLNLTRIFKLISRVVEQMVNVLTLLICNIDNFASLVRLNDTYPLTYRQQHVLSF